MLGTYGPQRVNHAEVSNCGTGVRVNTEKTAKYG